MFSLRYIILTASLPIFDDNYWADWSEANSIPWGVESLPSGNLSNCSGNDLLNLIDVPNSSSRKAVDFPRPGRPWPFWRPWPRRPPHGNPIHYNFARNKHNSSNFIQWNSLLRLPTKVTRASTNIMVKSFMVSLPKYHSILNWIDMFSTQFISTRWRNKIYKPINRNF